MKEKLPQHAGKIGFQGGVMPLGQLWPKLGKKNLAKYVRTSLRRDGTLFCNRLNDKTVGLGL